MNAAIYDKTTAMIRIWADGPPEQVKAQVGPNEAYLENCPDTATHVVNGLPVTRDILTREQKLEEVRGERNCKLACSDWTQAPDAPVDRAAWAAYRQKLRDFPAVCDPFNPVWPMPPNS